MTNISEIDITFLSVLLYSRYISVVKNNTVDGTLKLDNFLSLEFLKIFQHVLGEMYGFSNCIYYIILLRVMIYVKKQYKHKHNSLPLRD